MGAPSTGEVIIMPFPFSDLSQSKVRPVLCLAPAGQSDWICCQITSRAFNDPRAISIEDADFVKGGLQTMSYARPGKLFTADASLFGRVAGTIRPAKLDEIIDAVVALLKRP